MPDLQQHLLAMVGAASERAEERAARSCECAKQVLHSYGQQTVHTATIDRDDS